MSLLLSRSSTIFASALFILIGIDIAIACYGLLPIPLLISLNLGALGFIAVFRGAIEGSKDERKFYLIWGSAMVGMALSISLASLTSLVIGLALFFIILSAVLLFLSVRFSQHATQR